MNVLDAITSRAGRLAGEMQGSLKRARIEGERRMLARQHRTALEELGLRAYELVKAGELPDTGLTAEVAAVEAKLIEIEGKVAEIDDLRPADDAPEDTAGEGTEGAGDAPAGDRPAGDDPALAAFPMIADDPPPEDSRKS